MPEEVVVERKVEVLLAQVELAAAVRDQIKLT
jgi:hypothetical protein